MKKFSEFIQKIESAPISFGLWIASALSVIVIRDTLETIVADNALPFIHPFHLIHVPLFFLTVLLAITLILHFFSKTAICAISRVCLIFFCIIIVPPLIDLASIAIAPHDVSYGYITDHAWENFLHAFDPSYNMTAIPPSVRIEAAIILLFSFLYIFLKKRRVIISLIGTFTVFCAIFFFGALPAVFVNIFLFFRPICQRALTFFNQLFHHGTGFAVPAAEGVLDDPSLLIIELFITLVLAVIWYRRYDKNKWIALWNNLRLNRAAHYMLMGLLGLSLYLADTRVTDLFFFLKVIGMICAIFFAFQFAVVTNDIFDLPCDKVSNTKRPLSAGIFSKEEYLKIGFVYLAFSLLFAFFVGDYCFSITLFLVALSVSYSVPPFRLKRFLLISNAVLGLEALASFLLGQACLDPNGTLNPAYTPLWFLIFLIFFLASNIKDLKDVEGDRANNVSTLPVVLGEQKARKIIAGLVFLSYCLIPFFLSRLPFLHCPISLYIASFLFGTANLFYISKPHAREKAIFSSYFFYIFLLLLLINK